MDPTMIAIVFAGLGGLAIGSFLNVVAYRLPAHASLVSPGSACPGCGHAIRPSDNIPVVSWLLLRGRCRDCSTPISPRYPLVEAITAALWVAVIAVKGANEDAILGIVLVTLMVPVALIDLDYRIIPNRLLAPAAVVALGVQAVVGSSALPEHLIAGAAAGLFFLVVVLAYPRGMGMGDAKLAAVLGLFLGREVAVALLVALLVGSLFGIGVMVRKGVAEGRKTAVPFGPFLALGGIVALLVGAPIVHTYLTHFA
jgi:leader peptidase (prepilin peptidase)/N-methyltransferase